MKKVYYSLMALMLSGTSAIAQTNVILKVNDAANKEKTAIKFKGQFNSWADVDGVDNGTNGDATANDNIWTYEIQNVMDGTYEWGATDQNGAWLTPGVPNYTFTVSGSNVTGQTEIVLASKKPVHKVSFTVVDATKSESMIKLRGSMFGWDGGREMYDDGTNGDAVANDGTFTLEADIEEGSWEWGIENPCGWKLEGSNRQFTVAVGGAVSGDVSYTIPAVSGSPRKVTFRVDMGNEIVASSGVFVSGEFMSRIDGASFCNWDKDTLKLSAGSGDIYSIELTVYPGNYAWKFFNGNCGDDGCQENGDFKTGGCGDDNGLGGWNRKIDLSNLAGDTILPIYIYNSCNITPEPSSVFGVNKVAFSVYPNPAQGRVYVSTDAGIEGVVQLSDLSGRTISEINLNAGEAALNLSNLSKGVYLISITGENFKSTKKLFVE